MTLILNSIGKHMGDLSGCLEAYNLEGATILVVDDDPLMRKIFTRYLSSWNARVDAVDSGNEALRAVQEKQYDVLLMDIQMPGINGFDCTGFIRRLGGEYFKLLPVIAITSSQFAEIRRQMSECGMTGFIEKAFDPSELYLKIRSCLQSVMSNKLYAAL